MTYSTLAGAPALTNFWIVSIWSHTFRWEYVDIGSVTANICTMRNNVVSSGLKIPRDLADADMIETRLISEYFAVSLSFAIEDIGIRFSMWWHFWFARLVVLAVFLSCEPLVRTAEARSFFCAGNHGPPLMASVSLDL